MNKKRRVTDKNAQSLERAAAIVKGGPGKIDELSSDQVLELLSALLDERAVLLRDMGELVASNEQPSRSLSLHLDNYEDSPLGYQSLDAEGALLEVNRAWLEMLGYAREEVIGRWLGDFIVPSDRDVFRERFRRFKDVGEVRGAEFEMVCRDGSHVFASFDGNVSRDSQGSFCRTHCILRDITGQREAEKALRESEQRLALAIEGAGLAWWNQNLETGEVSRSEFWAEMLGYDAGDINGVLQAWKDLIHPDDRPAVEKMAKDHEAGLIPEFRAEHRMRTKDGGWKWILNWGRVIERDESGTPLRAAGVHLDITDLKTAEEELRTKNEAIEMSITGHGITDAQGKLLYVNGSLVKMWGYDRKDEIVGRYLPEFWHGDRVYDTMKGLFESGSVIGEDIGLRKDGSTFPVDFAATLLKDKSGRPAMMFGSFVDVTERKKAEAALAESQERYRSLVESSPVPIIVHRHGRLVYVNEAASRFLGTDEASVFVGRPVLDIIYPEDRDIIMRRLEQGERSTVDDMGEVRRTEFRLVRANGEIAHVVSTAMPVLFDGQLSQLAITIDITDRILAEKALAESEERHRTLQANLPVGVFRSTPDGRIISANEAMVKMYGYDSMNDLMKVRSVDFYCDPRERQELERRLEDEVSVVNHECRLKRKDGSVIWVSSSMYAQKDDQGRVIHFDGIDLDITARKEAEKALHMKNVALREVLGQFESERLDIGRAIKSNLDKTVVPLLASLRNRLDESDSLLLRQVERNLANLVSPFIRDLETQFASLSPRELEICSMIRNGSVSKEIAAQLRISAETVHKFRHLIRKKLGITNKDVNLASFLRACDQKQNGTLGGNGRTR